MHAFVGRWQAQPGKLDEAIGIIRDSVLPAACRVKGYGGAYVFADREASRFITVSLWETEADLVAMMSSAFIQEQIGKFAPLLAGPPERGVYEVVVQP